MLIIAILQMEFAQIQKGVSFVYATLVLVGMASTVQVSVLHFASTRLNLSVSSHRISLNYVIM